MHTRFIFSRFFSPRKRHCLFFTLFWAIGLLLGIVIATTSMTKYNIVIYTALTKRPSVVLHALICTLTLIAIALLRYNQCFFLIIPLLVLQGISRGFSGMTLYAFAGSGAWAVRLLLLFSGTWVSVITWWSLFRDCDRSKTDLIRALCLSAIFVFVILVVDYLVISPLTVSIINQIF